MDDRNEALIALGRALQREGYEFVTPTPETVRRVNARATAARREAATLRDVFGWNRPFAAGALPQGVLEVGRAADVFTQVEGRLRATVRFSTLRGRLFVHSAYPTSSADAVFFGPDTYRFCDLLLGERRGRTFRRGVDVGCGSGAGGLMLARHGGEMILADVNASALRFASVNAELAGLRATLQLSDVLRGVQGELDLVVANPPYMVDPSARAYRDGGGAYGEALAARIVREALERLEPGGQLILYTGAAIVDGRDTFFAAVREHCERHHWRYRELDPDVFGEEIESNDAYAMVERIAAVALVVTKR